MSIETVVNNKVAEQTEKLSFSTKFSYGIGDLASNLSWGLVSSYLLIFYTDVYGLAAGVVGVLILIARVWDCFIDPVIGLYIERKSTKFGRFRPYIIFGAVLLAIFNTLTFTTPSFGGTAKVAYACITYLLLGTIYSIVNVPYGALATVMTRDTEERTSLNSFRGFFSLISNVVLGAAVMPLISALGQGNNQRGYSLTALVLSLVSLPMFYLVFKNCKEVIKPRNTQHLSIKDSLTAVVKNKPLVLVLSHLFIFFTGLFGRLAVVVFYYIYVMGRPDLIAVLMMGFGVATAMGSVIVGFIGKYFEKKNITIFGTIIVGIGLIAIFFTPATNVTAIIAITIISSIPVGFGAPLVFSMVADCIDYSEWKYGTRADGAIYSTTSLITKISSALIGGLTAFALGIIGYVPNAMQSAETIKGLNTLVNLVPGIIYLIAVIPLLFYGITKEKARQYGKELDERYKSEA